jgi:hypothetical protein
MRSRGQALTFGANILLSQCEFDRLCKEGKFVDGPYRDTFGDGPYDPYLPHRQAFGRLQDGRNVYCETGEKA